MMNIRNIYRSHRGLSQDNFHRNASLAALFLCTSAQRHGKLAYDGEGEAHVVLCCLCGCDGKAQEERAVHLEKVFVSTPSLNNSTDLKEKQRTVAWTR